MRRIFFAFLSIGWIAGGFLTDAYASSWRRENDHFTPSQIVHSNYFTIYAEKDVDQGASRLVGSEGQAIIRRPIVFPERKIEKAMVRETVSATSSDIARHKGSRESSMGSLGDALNSKSKAVLDRMKDKARETVSPYTLASVN